MVQFRTEFVENGKTFHTGRVGNQGFILAEVRGGFEVQIVDALGKENRFSDVSHLEVEVMEAFEDRRK